MKHLVEFTLEQRGSALVEVDEPLTDPAMRGLGKNRPTVKERTDKTFKAATATIVPAARGLTARLRDADDSANEISMEFGVQLNAQTGALIASAAVGANFRTSMTRRSGVGT